MNGFVTTNPFLKPRLCHLSLTAAVSFFHSTAVLERRRNSQFRIRGKSAKQALLRDTELYLDHLMDDGFHNSQQDDPRGMSSSYVSWFEKQYFGKGTKRRRRNARTQCFQWESNLNQTSYFGSNFFGKESGSPTPSPSLFWNDKDDEECETIFGSAFGRQQDFYWSFHSENNGRGWSRRDRHERVHWDRRNYEPNHEHFWKGSFRSRTQSFSSDWKEDSHDRLTLGLTASGPLKLEEVKHAYRTCALQWHPDRHQGSSKVAAEEKFKCCTAAYKSICDKLLGDKVNF